jgi:hypothetical protein
MISISDVTAAYLLPLKVKLRLEKPIHLPSVLYDVRRGGFYRVKRGWRGGLKLEKVKDYNGCADDAVLFDDGELVMLKK